MHIARSKLAGHSVEDSVASTVIDQATFQCSWENWTDVFYVAIALFVGVKKMLQMFCRLSFMLAYDLDHMTFGYDLWVPFVFLFHCISPFVP